MKLQDIVSKYKDVQIITHNDLDGYGAGAVLVATLVKLGFGMNNIKVTHTDYTDVFPVDPKYNLVLISDISISNANDAKKIIEFVKKPNNLLLWFDHHRSSLDLSINYPELEKIPGIRSTAACGTMLCYIFYQVINYYKGIKDALIDDVIKELNNIDVPAIMKSNSPGIWNKDSSNRKTPIGILLTDDYDRFVLSDERSKYYMEAFNNYPGFEKNCKSGYFQTDYITGNDNEYINFIQNGRKIFTWKQILFLTSLKEYGFIASFPKEGMNEIEMLCLNSTSKGSLMFGKSYGYGNDTILQYNYGCIYSSKGDKTTVSVYCANPDPTPNYFKKIGKIYNAADICKRFDGGGHPGAAGFVTDKVPFCNIKPLPYALKKQIDDEISELFTDLKRQIDIGD